jgi:hypothetical protein
MAVGTEEGGRGAGAPHFFCIFYYFMFSYLNMTEAPPAFCYVPTAQVVICATWQKVVGARHPQGALTLKSDGPVCAAEGLKPLLLIRETFFKKWTLD